MGMKIMQWVVYFWPQVSLIWPKAKYDTPYLTLSSQKQNNGETKREMLNKLQDARHIIISKHAVWHSQVRGGGGGFLWLCAPRTHMELKLDTLSVGALGATNNHFVSAQPF